LSLIYKRYLGLFSVSVSTFFCSYGRLTKRELSQLSILQFETCVNVSTSQRSVLLRTMYRALLGSDRADSEYVSNVGYTAAEPSLMVQSHTYIQTYEHQFLY